MLTVNDAQKQLDDFSHAWVALCVLRVPFVDRALGRLMRAYGRVAARLRSVLQAENYSKDTVQYNASIGPFHVYEVTGATLSDIAIWRATIFRTALP